MEPIDGAVEPIDGAAATGEGALAAMQARDDYQAYVTAAEEVLAGVERALGRLDEGTYGTCSLCAQPIDDADLAATPTTACCAAHRPSQPCT